MNVTKDNILRCSGDMVFINASHRRSILNPWVYLCMGDENTRTAVWDHIVTGTWDNSPICYESTADIEHWHKALTRKRTAT